MKSIWHGVQAFAHNLGAAVNGVFYVANFIQLSLIESIFAIDH
jgi:hypothetical protein